MSRQTRHTDIRYDSSDESELKFGAPANYKVVLDENNTPVIKYIDEEHPQPVFGDNKTIQNDPLFSTVNSLSDERLFTTAGIVALENNNMHIPGRRQLLIEYIINDYDPESIDKALDDSALACNRFLKTDLPWVPENPSKRLTAFIDSWFGRETVKVDSNNNKHSIMLNIRLFWLRQSDYDKKIRKMERDWKSVQALTLNVRNIVFKDFSKYFKNSYIKSVKDIYKHKLSSIFSYRDTLKHIENHPLHDLEDCEIWLDLLTSNKLYRDEIVKSALKNYRQALRRSSNNRSQLNIEIPQKQRKNLENLCEKYEFSQSEIISILLEYEVSENRYLNRYQARLNEHVRIIQGSKTS